jgi:hypothetical protein
MIRIKNGTKTNSFFLAPIWSSYSLWLYDSVGSKRFAHAMIKQVKADWPVVNGRSFFIKKNAPLDSPEQKASRRDIQKGKKRFGFI